MSPDSFVHLEPEGDAFKVVVGPFHDAQLARHIADVLREFSTRGPGYVEAMSRIPNHVLTMVAEACDHLANGPGSFIVRGDGAPGYVNVELSKTSTQRAKDPRNAGPTPVKTKKT